MKRTDFKIFFFANFNIVIILLEIIGNSMICCFSNYFKVFANFSLFKGNRHGVLLDRHICLYSIPDSVSILLVCNLFLRLKSSSNSKVIEHTIRRSEGTPFIKSFMSFKKYVSSKFPQNISEFYSFPDFVQTSDHAPTTFLCCN